MVPWLSSVWPVWRPFLALSLSLSEHLGTVPDTLTIQIDSSTEQLYVSLLPRRETIW